MLVIILYVAIGPMLQVAGMLVANVGNHDLCSLAGQLYIVS